MGEKRIELQHIYISLKRTELLIEELLFRYCLHNNETDDKGRDEFKIALTNISNQLLSDVDKLPDVEPTDES